MSKNIKKYVSLLAMILVILQVATACSGGTTPAGTADSDKKLLVGVLVPTSGSEAYYGTDMLQSYQLAADEINAAGGILGRQIELYQADDGCDANMSSQAATKIISMNPDFIVGGYCSGATIPALQLFYDEDLLVLISAANSTDITKLGLEQTFMVNSPGTHAIATLVDLCKDLGSTKVALIHQGDAYTKNLSDISEVELPKAGIEIATVQVMEKGAPDVSAIVTAVRSSGADMVYWCGYFADGSNVIKQLRQGGYEGEICVGDGSSSPELITGCGDAGEGVYVTSPPFVEFSAGGEEFSKNYEAKYNMPPGTYATLSYDTMMVLKTAVEKAGTTELKAVTAAVAAIEHEGLSGTIKFAENRELAISNFIVLQIQSGKFTLVN